MKGRLPLPSGHFLEVEMTPEELAAFVRLTAAAPAPVAPAQAAAPPPAPAPARRPAPPPAPVLDVDPEEEARMAGVPEPTLIKEFIASRPDFEHTMSEVLQHFGSQPLSPTNPDGTISALHQRWNDAINKARAMIIQEKKGFFKTEWRGREKVYVFWYAPFQEWTGPGIELAKR